MRDVPRKRIEVGVGRLVAACEELVREFGHEFGHPASLHGIRIASSAMATARIEALFRYPVKSMLGEQIDVSVVGERGLLGDRAYALIDEETGKVASAKNPRRW